jgi:hypothetical protein
MQFDLLAVVRQNFARAARRTRWTPLLFFYAGSDSTRTTKDIGLTMRSVVSLGEKKADKKNLAVLEKLQEAAALGNEDSFVYTISEPISDLYAAPLTQLSPSESAVRPPIDSQYSS